MAKKKPLSKADKDAAKRLRGLWDAAVSARRNTDHPLTQDRMVEKFESTIGRGTQGLVSQYLNAHIPLGYRALLAFSEEIGCAPEEIRNDLPEQHLRTSRSNRGGVEESSPPPYGLPPARELTELQLVTGLIAKVLAATIQPAGRQLLAELEKLPSAMKSREFVGAIVDTIRSEIPDQPASRRVRESGARKSR